MAAMEAAIEYGESFALHALAGTAKKSCRLRDAAGACVARRKFCRQVRNVVWSEAEILF